MLRNVCRVFAIAVTFLAGTSGSASAQEVIVYYHTDAIGSVRMITDESGSVVANYHFLPFGEAFPVDPQAPADKRMFTGTERDPETSFDYLGARYYQAQTGRFTRPDDPGFADPFHPQSMNLFAYANNNPLRYFDPDGHQAVFVDVGYGYGLDDQTIFENQFLRDLFRRYLSPVPPVSQVVDVSLSLVFPVTPQEQANALSLSLMPMAGMAVVPRIGRFGNAGLQIARDATGKVHGILPRIEAFKRASLQVVREAVRELRASILVRKQELRQLGEHASHRARIGEEEALLRSLEKHLENLLGAKNVR